MRAALFRRQLRGVSLVELMVGIAVGLMVLAAASTVVTAQLGSTRQLLMETQIDQDLRTAAEVVTRELRRSGASVIDGGALWFSTAQTQMSPSDARLPTLTPGDETNVLIRYRRGPGEEGFGFKLEDSTLKMLIPDGSGGAWQELTDPASVRVLKFSISRTRVGVRERKDNLRPHVVPCPYLCPDGTTDCWPRAIPQEFTLELVGESRRDPSVRRTLRTSVAARTQLVAFESFSGQHTQLNQACPTLPS